MLNSLPLSLRRQRPLVRRTLLASLGVQVAAAYSLRKIGPETRCVRVLRTSDNAEADIGFLPPAAYDVSRSTYLPTTASLIDASAVVSEIDFSNCVVTLGGALIGGRTAGTFGAKKIVSPSEIRAVWYRVDGLYYKALLVSFTQVSAGLQAAVVDARWTTSTSAQTWDYDQWTTANTAPIVTSDGGNGYGVATLALRIKQTDSWLDTAALGQFCGENLFPRSTGFTTGWMIRAGMTVVDNAALAPDGTMTATRITTVDSWSGYIWHQYGLFSSVGQAKVFTIWARAISGSVPIRASAYQAGITSSGNGVDKYPTSAWQKFTWALTADSATSFGGGDFGFNFLGVGTVEVWHPQLTDTTEKLYCDTTGSPIYGRTSLYKTYYDATGNGRHATQPDTAKMPRIVNAGVLETKNGRPAMRFYAGGVHMPTPRFAAPSTNWAHFAVASADNVTSNTNNVIGSDGEYSSAGYFAQLHGTACGANFSSSGVGRLAQAGQMPVANTLALFGVTHSASNTAQAFLNGVPGAATNVAGWTVGASEFAIGKYSSANATNVTSISLVGYECEHIVTAGVPSTTARQAYESNAKAAFGTS